MSSSIPVLNIPKYHADELMGRVHSVESFGTIDGPGTRYVVFLQGCLFRCKYCHNRDTWDLDGGTLYTVTEMVEQILPYTKFMDASGGGVTVTGGEPVLQAAFVGLLFQKLHEHRIHTCLDTNGYLGVYNDESNKMIEESDLIMVDIKHINDHKHHLLVGVSNQRTLRFVRHLADIGKRTRVRYVVVPGYSDDIEDVKALAQFLAPMENVEHVELLPYHNLGTHKWKALGIEYPLEGMEPPPVEKMDEIQAVMESYGLHIIR